PRRVCPRFPTSRRSPRPDFRVSMWQRGSWLRRQPAPRPPSSICCTTSCDEVSQAPRSRSRSSSSACCRWTVPPCRTCRNSCSRKSRGGARSCSRQESPERSDRCAFRAFWPPCKLDHHGPPLLLDQAHEAERGQLGRLRIGGERVVAQRDLEFAEGAP